MYLLELVQGERCHTVGLFEEKTDAEEWIASVPYLRKSTIFFEEMELEGYVMDYEDLPLYEEIIWAESRFPLTKYMFTLDDGTIKFYIWESAPIINETEGLIDGMTQVDAYMIPNSEVKDYVQHREEVRKRITAYYEEQGRKVDSGGLGSQDGEYLLIEGGPLIHLDVSIVRKWLDKTSEEDFIEQIK